VGNARIVVQTRVLLERLGELDQSRYFKQAMTGQLMAEFKTPLVELFSKLRFLALKNAR
jgi:hypothetical protein